jgi:hypothetical protein
MESGNVRAIEGDEPIFNLPADFKKMALLHFVGTKADLEGSRRNKLMPLGDRLSP